MKKFLALATLLVTLLALPLTAGAERSGWKSNTFPFKRLKVVYLKDLSRQDGGFQKAHPAFIRDDDAVRKTFLTLQRDLKKEGVTLYNNPVMLPDKQLRNTITLQGGESIVVPASTQTLKVEGTLKFLETYV